MANQPPSDPDEGRPDDGWRGRNPPSQEMVDLYRLIDGIFANRRPITDEWDL